MAARKGFPLRLDPKLYEELRRWADAEFRSVNAQIEYVLRRAVEARRGQDERRPDRAGEQEGGNDDEP
jgi:hypothetical protein